MSDQKTPQQQTEKVVELVKDIKIAMLTYTDSRGHLVSKPMATQDADFSGDLWFITERDTEKVADIQANPHVNLAYSGRGSWVSVSGTAEVVNDEAKLRELWSTFTSSWLEGGPENPNNVLLHVTAETAEYWDSPGGMVANVVNLVKAATTGKRLEGDNETVRLD